VSQIETRGEWIVINELYILSKLLKESARFFAGTKS
jgi:hypothetical protein